MNEHGRLKIARCEHLRDVFQMRPDFIASHRIACIARVNLDCSSIRKNPEMMR